MENSKRNSPAVRDCCPSSCALVHPTLSLTGYALYVSDARIAGRERVDVARADGCADEGTNSSFPENCAGCRYSSSLPPQLLAQANVRDVDNDGGSSDLDRNYVVASGEDGPISSMSSETCDRPHTSSALPSLTPTTSDNKEGNARATRTASRLGLKPSLGLFDKRPALPGARRRLRSTSALGSNSRSRVKHDPGRRRVSGKPRGYLRKITQRCSADSLKWRMRSLSGYFTGCTCVLLSLREGKIQPDEEGWRIPVSGCVFQGAMT